MTSKLPLLIVLAALLSSGTLPIALADETCSQNDIEASSYLMHMNKEEASKFARKAYKAGEEIQKAIKDKNINKVMSLIDGELINGPRKSFMRAIRFDEIFPRAWQENVSSEKPPCSPLGSRGFMLGQGLIWYNVTKDGKPSIFSINGANEESLSFKKKNFGKHNGQDINSLCYTRIWRSGDNYEFFFQEFANEGENELYSDAYYEFTNNIGLYIQSKVPLGSVEHPWLEDYRMWIAPSLSSCQEEKDINEDEFEVRIIKDLPTELCKSLMPQVKQGCKEVALATIVGPLGYSSTDFNTAIYAKFSLSSSEEIYITPLMNFDSENEALNYIDNFHPDIRVPLPTIEPAPAPANEQSPLNRPETIKYNDEPISPQETLSLSEMDIFRYQVANCWGLIASGELDKDTIIYIKLDMKPDGTINNIELIDKKRYNTDSKFAEAADMAVEALNHSSCSPFDLPSDKYDKWKVITIKFDPTG